MNPGSRSGKSKKLFNKIFSLLNEANIDYEYHITNSINEAHDYSVTANKLNFKVIVAVGGDGTINAVLNGFYDSVGNRISDSKMGVIYTGTSPDFCKSYHIPIDIESAIKTLLNQNVQSINIGKIIYSNENIPDTNEFGIDAIEQPAIKYFGCCANIGLGASLARRANSGIRKYLGDFLGTFVSLLITLLLYRANSFFIIKDSNKTSVSKLYNLSVGRTKYIASGIKIHSNVAFEQNGFYCLTARAFTLFNLPGIIKKIYSGKEFRNNDNLSIEYIEQIEIMGNSKNPEIELDGDPIGYLPCKIEITKDCLQLIVNNV